MRLPHLVRIVRKVWERQGLWGSTAWVFLVPLSMIFSLLVRGRNFLYDRRFLPTERLSLRVISVGNLTVGGSGKTPTVLWLASALIGRGYRVGIIAQGYGGKNSGITVVRESSRVLATPAEVGDEAVMLARIFSGVVLAARDRAAAARLAYERFNLEVVILDDAFQYRRLERDLDLLLLSGSQGVGNGWVLPAGPLREPLDLAKRTHFLMVMKGPVLSQVEGAVPDRQSLLLRLPALSHALSGAEGSASCIFHGDLKPQALVVSQGGVWQEQPLATLAGMRVLALSAVADPVPFYRMLREWGADIIEVLEFPDHHAYTVKDWQAITVASRRADLVVTTEKDLVKLEGFPFAAGRLVALRVCVEVEEGEQLLAEVERRLWGQKEEWRARGGKGVR
ncbi:MAG: tetraacyldisaccharide 4'-kinase [Deltaproteobacteria bacterium]|nr:tetraacyldisaccharide 4'-kinase [Deltaproteobacteria bacterium]